MEPLERDYYDEPFSDDDNKFYSSDEEEEDVDLAAAFMNIAECESNPSSVFRRHRSHSLSRTASRSRSHSRTRAGSRNEGSLSNFEFDIEEEISAAFKKHNSSLLQGFNPADSEPQMRTNNIEAMDCSNICMPSKDLRSKIIHRKLEPQNITRKMEKKNRSSGAAGYNKVEDILGLNDDDTLSDEEFRQAEGMNHFTDNDLFYDPKSDDENQQWIDEHRKSFLAAADRKKRLPNSDAVLNCPVCMTTLCMDCQRHEIYKTQYRAMFVSNCIVKTEDTLICPEKKNNRKNTNSNLSPPPTFSSTQRISDGGILPTNVNRRDLFHPVLCGVCRTEVGVIDQDEVYHFFNVLSSY